MARHSGPSFGRSFAGITPGARFEGGGNQIKAFMCLQNQGKLMSILAWIILGLVAGFIGSKIVNKTGEGVFLDIVLGIVGAVVGGWLFSAFGMSRATGLNIYSLLVAVVGAVVVLVVYHALMGRRRSL